MTARRQTIPAPQTEAVMAADIDHGQMHLPAPDPPPDPFQSYRVLASQVSDSLERLEALESEIAKLHGEHEKTQAQREKLLPQENPDMALLGGWAFALTRWTHELRT